MPFFAIHCLDKPMAGDLRAATRPAHLDHLRDHADRLFAAGPLLGPEGETIGSLIIIDLPDRDSAYRFAAADPYALAGLFLSVAVTAWRKVLPADPSPAGARPDAGDAPAAA
jgi:hypothetical protein